MPGPLDGIKVLELTQIIAGPYCGVALADLGAEVVKLESPVGDASRRIAQFAPGESKAFHALNRGKRGLVINLATTEGQAVAHQLIPHFDVFVTNVRPGVAERIGMDFDTLRQFRSDLIYFDVTGYGDRGPSAQRAGSDVVVQAYSGLLAGDLKVGPDGAPEQITASAPSDYIAALGGAMGVCAALFHRERTGEGQRISGTLLGAGLALQAPWAADVPVSDSILLEPLRRMMSEMRAAGASYAEMIEARRSRPNQGKAFRIYYSGYPVKDGAIILGALTLKTATRSAPPSKSLTTPRTTTTSTQSAPTLTPSSLASKSRSKQGSRAAPWLNGSASSMRPVRRPHPSTGWKTCLTTPRSPR